MQLLLIADQTAGLMVSKFRGVGTVNQADNFRDGWVHFRLRQMLLDLSSKRLMFDRPAVKGVELEKFTRMCQLLSPAEPRCMFPLHVYGGPQPECALRGVLEERRAAVLPADAVGPSDAGPDCDLQQGRSDHQRRQDSIPAGRV